MDKLTRVFIGTKGFEGILLAFFSILLFVGFVLFFKATVLEFWDYILSELNKVFDLI